MTQDTEPSYLWRLDFLEAAAVHLADKCGQRGRNRADWMASPAATSRTLRIDSRAPAGADCARSRREALERLTAGEYDTIVLHTAAAGRDEYGLVAYLAATWPTFLRNVTVRTITSGADSYEWNHQKGGFDRLRPSSRRSRGVSPRVHSPPPFLRSS